jgi:polar amino acid transport system substrate-binding protein
MLYFIWINIQKNDVFSRRGMQMKKIVTVTALILAFCVITPGCSGGAGGGGGKNTNAGLLNSSAFKVGMELGYPPFEFFDDNNDPAGLDVDLAAELAKQLGVKVVYEDTAWDGIFDGLGIDKYDAVISAVTITAPRRETMDFSEPYVENWQSVVVKKGSAPITSLDMLNGLSVGFQDSTTSDETMAMLKDTGAVSCETFGYDKVLNAFDDLRYGRIDCVMSDSVVSEGYVDREPDVFEITWHQKDVPGDEPERFAVAMKKDNAKLRDAVNKALAELEKSGKLNEIRAEWLR